MKTLEVAFNGLVGPTHNYAGLSHGNVASETHASQISRPRQAALQGLEKLRLLFERGVPCGILPPQERPSIGFLRQLGFTGSDVDVLSAAAKQPRLLAAASSASCMWTANAATVSPSADTDDGRVHFTPANLASKLHRTLEPDATARALRRVFHCESHFAHHAPLPGGVHLGDEGAANHTRLCSAPGARGLELFTFGRRAFGGGAEPTRYPARQTLEASEAIARRHGLAATRTFFLQQSPDAIDAGVFHNDVIAVGHEDLLLLHERAYVEHAAALEDLRRAFDGELCVVEARESELPLAHAVGSYLFNSELLRTSAGSRLLLAPQECAEDEPTARFIERLLAWPGTPVDEVHYVDLRESMQNGGGPACLRLRVSMTVPQYQSVLRECLYDLEAHDKLTAWIECHYREQLSGSDLADPALLDESRRALDELTGILALGSDFYEFQRVHRGRS
ncbi:MAG: N-succinylarginine dihydrolase [Deltaproteobacteria bacterium]|nr:N-succinylarginine dihydrolase [Deltaproteobacteria bacterium]